MEGKLHIIFKGSQCAPWSDLNGFEKVIEMIAMYREVRGTRAAGTALVLRWAAACNISPVRLVKRIREDEILDSEMSDYDEQEGVKKDKLKDSMYVAIHLEKKMNLLHSNPKHLSNARIYNEIFDVIHCSYLSMYNDKYAMSTSGWIDKKSALHIIGKNFYLDSTLYPNMINLMVKSGKENMFKKIAGNKSLRDRVLDGVKDEGLTSEFALEDYDKAIG